MRCHYDVLRLTRDCSDDDIKKSYRKLALQWHPGKYVMLLNKRGRHWLWLIAVATFTPSRKNSWSAIFTPMV